MSALPFVVRWRRAIRDDRELSWRARLIALVIAEHLDGSTSPTCWPSLELLAAESGTARSTVERGVRELRDAHWLHVSAGGGRHTFKGGRMANTYRPTLATVTRSQPPEGYRPPQLEVPTATARGSDRHTVAKKPKKKPKKKPTSAALARTRPRDPIFDTLVEACGLDYADMTKAARRACGVAAAELAGLERPPDREEILRRAARYPADWVKTPNALARHWATLGARRPQDWITEALAKVAPDLQVLEGGQS